jgi:hypothetical protein
MKALFTLLVILTLTVKSQNTVTAISSGNWSSNTTWLNGNIPSSSDCVIIPSGFNVQIDSTAYCRDITINSGASLSSDSAVVLNVNRYWSNSGTFNHGKGKVAFNGTVIQHIGGTASNDFYDLEVNNNNFVSLVSNITAKGTISINSGTLVTTGYSLTLLSDNFGTGAIGPIAAGSDLIGNITVQRYLSSTATGWRFLGSPVRTTLADWSDDFETSGFPGSTYPWYNWYSIYTYDETVGGTSDYGYNVPADVSDSIYEGVGYWCWIGPTPTLIQVTGRPNKFSHSFNVSLTPSAGKGEDGWNMLSNPYPSAIDWDAAGWTKTGISNAIYIWDPVLGQYTSYVNGVGVNGGSNIIPSSQAFWVEASQQNPVLTCNETVKTTQDKIFQRSMNQNPKTVIKLALSGSKVSTDQIAVCVSAAGSEHFMSNEDARKLLPDDTQSPYISTIADSVALSINTVPDASQNISIPVKVHVGTAGVYTISRDSNLQVPSNWCVSLEDLVTGNKTNLASVSQYTFFISDTTVAPRFLLHISKPASLSSKATTCSYKNNGKAVVNYAAAGQWKAKWMDMNNQEIASHVNVSGSDSLQNMVAGAYKVIILDNGAVCQNLTNDFTIDAAQALNTGAVISNNNCKYDHNGSIHPSVNGGLAPYHYRWSNGESSPMLQNLSNGSYTLVVTDANGCVDTTSHLVNSLSNLQAKFSIQNDTNAIYVNDLVLFKNEAGGIVAASWDFGNGTSGSFDPTHTFAQQGRYTVSFTCYDASCVSTCQKSVRVIDPSRLSSYSFSESGDVNVYQDDDHAVVQFDMQQPSAGSIAVYSADGKLVSSMKTEAFRNTESIALGASHGLYIVRVEANGNVYQEKLMK